MEERAIRALQRGRDARSAPTPVPGADFRELWKKGTLVEPDAEGKWLGNQKPLNQRQHLEEIEMLEEIQLIRANEGQDIWKRQLQAFWLTGDAYIGGIGFISMLDEKRKVEIEAGKKAQKAKQEAKERAEKDAESDSSSTESRC